MFNKEPKLKLTFYGILANALMFFAKMFAGIISGSIAIIADALNSLFDMISSVAIFWAVKVGHQEADEEHTFGHTRAEPLAGFVVAIFAGVVGFEIIRSAVGKLIAGGNEVHFGYLAASIIVVGVIVKAFLYAYFTMLSKKSKSPAMEASALDSRNDILAGLVVLLGFWMGGVAESVVAILVALFILYSGYNVGMENIGFLMGKSPDKELLDKIKSIAMKRQNVIKVKQVRAHYVGHYVHVELKIVLDKDLNLQQAHDVGNSVRDDLTEIEEIDQAFIHLDYV